ncbi:hypothetical protein GY45DRAFT_324954 [Cubamyces sp. BRFM 1775]|nr:hypothetical protein GY45DRAFT_324954 [Cubamyces sp. BRFM 1775]
MDASSTTAASSITANVIQALNASLAQFQTSLGCLNEDRISQIRQDGEKLIDSQIHDVRAKMVGSNQYRAAQVEDIDKLVKKIFEEELVAQLQGLITAGVLQDIDDLVKAEVEARLPEYMSEEHKMNMKQHEEELAKLERDLYNSESVRKNATLLPGDMDAEISPILTDKGEPAAQFPRTLDDLFRISADSASELLKEYGLPVKPSRDDNINAILELIGASKIRMAPLYGGPSILCSPTTAARAQEAGGSKT